MNLSEIDNILYKQKLKPYQMSVYLRIRYNLSNSICDESIKNIANACVMSESSVKIALKKLKSLNMIKIDSGKNDGTSNHIILVSPEKWMKNI